VHALGGRGGFIRSQVREPGVVARDRERYREHLGWSSLRVRQRRAEPGVFDLYSFAADASLEVGVVLAEVVPKPREVSEFAGPEYTGVGPAPPRDVFEMLGEYLPL